MKLWKNLLITIIIIGGIVGVLFVMQSLSEKEEKSSTSSFDTKTPIPLTSTITPIPKPTPIPQEETDSGGIPYLKPSSELSQIPPSQNPRITSNENYSANNPYSKKDIIYNIAKRNGITITSYKEEVVGKPTITGVAEVHNAFGDFLDDLISEIGMRDFNEDRSYFQKMTTRDGKWLYRAKFTITYY